MQLLNIFLKVRPSLSISIYKAYTYIALYILIAYAIMLWRRSCGATVIIDILRVCIGHVLITNCNGTSLVTVGMSQ